MVGLDRGHGRVPHPQTVAQALVVMCLNIDEYISGDMTLLKNQTVQGSISESSWDFIMDPDSKEKTKDLYR